MTATTLADLSADQQYETYNQLRVKMTNLSNQAKLWNAQRRLLVMEFHEFLVQTYGGRLPVSTDRNVFPVDSNEVHQALARIFKHKKIPVIDRQSMEVDWSRVPLEDRKGAPKLQFNLIGVAEEDIHLKTVRKIIDFLHEFETFYKDELTILFDHMAWRYMQRALKAADLHIRYEQVINSLEPEEKTWTCVEETIKEIFKPDLMQAEILDELLSAKARRGEDAQSFADRIEALYRVTNIPSMGQVLVAKIVRYLMKDAKISFENSKKSN
ncbi:hypothetical protein BGZ65_000843 [Modicella reniformis]|uniref:Uncharacterized protein n=1 Tax=Modicella reniformis TaxID=1440133 RepID=A0A9P6SQA1_9FUNG|nr:hypothetical protein BGZ65_000843 [Modicella reniformis]